jgi:predicted transcriptional regulator
MSKSIRIGIKDPDADDSMQGVIDAWHRAERGEPPEEPVHRIYFQDLETLLRVLSVRRLELLKALRKAGPMNVRALAKLLGRDYKNVHQDVARLEKLGLIERSGKQAVMVPWESISFSAEIRLAAA